MRMRMITMVLKSHVCVLQICVHKYCSKTSFYLCIHAHCLKLHKYATKIYIMGVVDSSVVYEGPSFTVNTTPLKGEVRKLPDVNGRRHMYQVFIFIPFSSLSGPILNTQLSLNVSPSAKSILLRLLLQSRLKIKCFALRDKKCICVDKFCPNYAKS